MKQSYFNLSYLFSYASYMALVIQQNQTVTVRIFFLFAAFLHVSCEKKKNKIHPIPQEEDLEVEITNAFSCIPREKLVRAGIDNQTHDSVSSMLIRSMYLRKPMFCQNGLRM